MGFLDIIGGAVGGALNAWAGVCGGLPTQSAVNLNMGTQGTTTQAIPLFLNTSQNPIVVTQFKVAGTVLGVLVPIIENANLANDYRLAGVQAPQFSYNRDTAEYIGVVQQATAQNPTLSQVTYWQWAIIVVPVNPGFTPNYTVPYANFTNKNFLQVLASQTPNQTIKVGFANVVDNASCLLWYMAGVSAGYANPTMFQSGFKNCGWPGPIILGSGDYLQLIYMASNDFTFPQLGIPGMWARMVMVTQYDQVTGSDDFSSIRIDSNEIETSKSKLFLSR